MTYSVQPVLAQPAASPFRFEPLDLASGIHAGPTAADQQATLAWREEVRFVGASWLQLHFGDYNLGEKSYLNLTSLQDGQTQRLDQNTLPEWNHSSGLFNGEAVEIQLHVAPRDRGVYVRLKQAVVGERQSTPVPLDLCGADDRSAEETENAVGRIMPNGCTGFQISNGLFLTAGHCRQSYAQILEFEVPLSLPDGTFQSPGLEHQYAITWLDSRDEAGGYGKDWAIFKVGKNSEGLLPADKQQAYFRISQSELPTTFRITGYGSDSGTANGTLQTATGPQNGETSQSLTQVYWKYAVDTQPGNSGSPIIGNGTTIVVGIHTDSGCASAAGNNFGTSVDVEDMESAILAFHGTSAVYVDSSHPATSETGSLFYPYDTIAEGISAASSGGTVVIAGGTYNEILTINKNITLKATGADVIVGNNLTVSTGYTLTLESGTFELANSKKITVNSAGDLVIKPDVRMQFGTSAYLWANGQVDIQGGIFEKAGTGTWSYIYLNGSGADGSTIRNVTIKVKGASFDIHTNNADNVVIENVTIEGGTYGLKLFNSLNVSVKTSVFKNASSHGAYIDASDVDFLDGNDFTGNGTVGIAVRGSSTGYMGFVDDLADCVIENNGQYGISVYNSSTSIIGQVLTGDDWGGNCSIQNNITYNAHVTLSSTLWAQLTWWGTNPPPSSKFYADGTSLLRTDLYLTSPPGAGPDRETWVSPRVFASVEGAIQTQAELVRHYRSLYRQDVVQAEALLTNIRRHGDALLRNRAEVLYVQHLLQEGRIAEALTKGTQALVRIPDETEEDEETIQDQITVSKLLFYTYLLEVGDTEAALEMKATLTALGDDDALNGLLDAVYAHAVESGTAGVVDRQALSAHDQRQQPLQVKLPEPVQPRDHLPIRVA
jgi:V8-like Glu-specific endopeptidase